MLQILEEFCTSPLPPNIVFQILFNNEKIDKIAELLDKIEENVSNDVPKMLKKL